MKKHTTLRQHHAYFKQWMLKLTQEGQDDSRLLPVFHWADRWRPRGVHSCDAHQTSVSPHPYSGATCRLGCHPRA